MRRFQVTTYIRLVAGLALLACAPRKPADHPPADPPGDPRGRPTTTATPGDRRRGGPSEAYVRSIYGPTWTLVQMGGAPAPAGSGGRPATLVLYSGTDRQANGYAGCNRWSSTYTLAAPDSIRFAPPVTTRMACAEGLALEARFLRFLEETRRAAQRDSTLTLFTSSGDSARFLAR